MTTWEDHALDSTCARMSIKLSSFVSNTPFLSARTVTIVSIHPIFFVRAATLQYCSQVHSIRHIRRWASKLNPPPTAAPHSSPTMLSIGGMSPHLAAAQALNFLLVLGTAYMLWKGLSVITDSPSPIVVVLSGSMEPAFQRGDLLFLWNRGKAATEVGEVVVYNVRGKDIPIVHRVVRRFGGGYVLLSVYMLRSASPCACGRRDLV